MFRPQFPFLLFLVAVFASLFAPRAEAQFATGGSGLYKPQIFWVDFGNNNDNVYAGATVTRGFNVDTPASAANRLDITCSIGNATTPRGRSGLYVYTPGNYRGDGLDNLYNIGGFQNGDTSPNPNTLSIGLRTNDAATVEFDFTCAATLGGQPFPLSGLVFADAETSINTEYVAARLTGGGTLRVIDQISQCGTSSTVSVAAGPPAEVRFGAPTAPQTNCQNNPTVTLRAGPMLVGYIEGATSGRVVVFGGGQSAAGIGTFLSLEFSEAVPASYGNAIHVLNPVFTGGVATPGVNFNNPANLATLSVGPHLGATVIADTDANGPVGGSDVDALPRTTGPAGAGYANVPPPQNVPGSTYTIANIPCTGAGFVAGWIDFNGNGVFDSNERSAVVNCAAGNSAITLSWTIPATGIVSQATSYLRLRLSSTATGVAAASGLAPDGEAEDYRFVLLDDYGDAPDAAAGTASGDYSTRAADNGAVHAIGATAAMYLGSIAPDADNGSLQNATATADDTTGQDDEEGLGGIPATATKGQTYNLTVTTTGSGFLNAWIDWNRDGDFLDAGEQIATGRALGGGNSTLAITVPNNASPGVTFIRLRYSSTRTLASVGSAPDGEIEDHAITVGASSDLVITKTNTPAQGVNDQSGDSVVRGATTTYTVVVTNNGPDAADNAVVSDPPGTNLSGCTVLGCTPAASCPATLNDILTAAGSPLPSLPSGTQVQLQVRCNVVQP